MGKRNEDKVILDVCCGGRMFWFNKNHPKALYIDIREEQDFQTGKGVDNRHRAIKPDVVMDFRKLGLPANSFNLVVFDPPPSKDWKEELLCSNLWKLRRQLAIGLTQRVC